VAAGQLKLTGGAQPIFVFFPNPRKTSIQLLLEAQQHKKYAQTTPLDDGVSSLFRLNRQNFFSVHFLKSLLVVFFLPRTFIFDFLEPKFRFWAYFRLFDH
jgi:hypothetical protein